METKTPDAGAEVWLKVPQVAEELKIPLSRAYDLVARGELPAVRIGERSIRINRRELETFLLESRRVVANRQEVRRQR